jgi:hypothetical protein
MLDLCREISAREPAAAGALSRWQAWQEALAEDCPGAESRFLRRAYERARQDAMCVLVMALARERRRVPRRGGSGARRRPGSHPLRHRAPRIGDAPKR